MGKKPVVSNKKFECQCHGCGCGVDKPHDDIFKNIVNHLHLTGPDYFNALASHRKWKALGRQAASELHRR